MALWSNFYQGRYLYENDGSDDDDDLFNKDILYNNNNNDDDVDTVDIN